MGTRPLRWAILAYMAVALAPSYNNIYTPRGLKGHSWKGGGTLPQNSYKPSQELIESTL